jgi:16S rRNA (uracil1498-N3)-methyltransferase
VAPSPVTARAHAFVDDLAEPRLSDADHHHLARVLRLPPGAEITVGDGAGRWRAACLSGSTTLVPVGEVVADPRPDPPITVAFALVKGERPELTVQKLTELGADRIVPFVAERSVVRWDAAKAMRQAERLRAIAREAAMQCRRTWLPDIGSVVDFAEAAALPGAALADLDGEPPSLARPVVLVGPEGGWSPAERAAKLPRVRLAGYVLRAETASITICGLLSALRDEIVTEARDTNTLRG